MCGRYVLEHIAEFSERVQLRQLDIRFKPSYNVAPSHTMPVFVEHEPDVWDVKMMHWGLLPRWKNPGTALPPQINARGETIAEKPLFRGLVRTQRCLVPASGFYEWKAGERGGRKQPYFFHLPQKPLFTFAGLWDSTRPEDADEEVDGSFVIVTTAANAFMSEFHHRMPVILDDEGERLWVSGDVQEPEALASVIVPRPVDDIEAYPVSTAVNSVRNNTPSLIEPETTERVNEPVQESLFS